MATSTSILYSIGQNMSVVLFHCTTNLRKIYNLNSCIPLLNNFLDHDSKIIVLSYISAPSGIPS